MIGVGMVVGMIKFFRPTVPWPIQEEVMTKIIRSHKELEVYKRAFMAAMEIFQVSQKFPKEEVYSLTDQIRRSSRSVCSNLAEAWRKRRYEAAFISKLSDSEMEAAETQVWLDFAVECGYLDAKEAAKLYQVYDGILATLVGMIPNADSWVLPTKRPSPNK